MEASVCYPQPVSLLSEWRGVWLLRLVQAFKTDIVMC